MIINGVEIGDLDIFNADVAEKYERTLEKVNESQKGLEGLKTSVLIRKQCETVFFVFDELFGEGTSKKLFGDSVNLITCLNAFETLVEGIKSKNEEIDKISSKYSQNRAQRRKK